MLPVGDEQKTRSEQLAKAFWVILGSFGIGQRFRRAEWI